MRLLLNALVGRRLLLLLLLLLLLKMAVGRSWAVVPGVLLRDRRQVGRVILPPGERVLEIATGSGRCSRLRSALSPEASGRGMVMAVEAGLR